MRLNSCLIFLHLSILAAILVPLEADGEDYECEDEIRVRHGTVYEAVAGEDLRIQCKVVFCNNSPPTITWYKLEKHISLPVSISSHIKTEWNILNHSAGILYLIFQKILISDSGEYQCRSGNSFGHSINVSVSVGPTTPDPPNAVQDTFWPYVNRVVGVVVFFIIVMILYVTARSGCKAQCVRCPGRSRDAPEPSPQPSDHISPSIHIYENDLQSPCLHLEINNSSLDDEYQNILRC